MHAFEFSRFSTHQTPCGSQVPHLPWRHLLARAAPLGDVRPRGETRTRPDRRGEFGAPSRPSTGALTDWFQLVVSCRVVSCLVLFRFRLEIRAKSTNGPGGRRSDKRRGFWEYSKPIINKPSDTYKPRDYTLKPYGPGPSKRDEHMLM